MKALPPPKKLCKRQDNNANGNRKLDVLETIRRRIRNPNGKGKYRRIIHILAREIQKKKRGENNGKEAKIGKKSMNGRADQDRTGGS